MRIQIEVFGMKAVNRTLDAYIGASTDLRPAWVAIGDIVAQTNRATIAAGQAGGWAPLSPAYAVEKERHYPGRPLLVRTGALYDRLTSEFDVRIIEPQHAAFGTALEYGQYHQTGTPRMPQRRPVVVDETTKRRIVRTIQAHLAAARSARSGTSTIIEGAA